MIAVCHIKISFDFKTVGLSSDQKIINIVISSPSKVNLSLPKGHTDDHPRVLFRSLNLRLPSLQSSGQESHKNM